MNGTIDKLPKDSNAITAAIKNTWKSFGNSTTFAIPKTHKIFDKALKSMQIFEIKLGVKSKIGKKLNFFKTS